jgi:hypothetical protein
VPIVIKSEFTNILQKNNVPLVILDSWDDLDETKLNYDIYDFNNDHFVKISDYYKIFLL